jgi:calcium-dependent protein kinase
MKLQEAALTFIVCQLSTKKEQEELLNTFKTFDKNGNGTISRDELLEGYKEIYGNKMTEEEIVKEVNEIMDKLDIDKSGNVDYTEWAVGTIDKKDILSQ